MNIFSENNYTIKNNTAECNDVTDVDPLQGCDIHEPKTYRLKEKIFADPLPIQVEDIHSEETHYKEDFTFIDNVTVQQRHGKRNKYHINVTDTTNLGCPQANCTSQFSTMSRLKNHVRRVHCADPYRSKCAICGASFHAQYLLKRHMATHDGQKQECPVCGRMLSVRTILVVHLRAHRNARPHKCATCDKTFVRKATLNTHVKFVHGTELKCDRCGERFNRRLDLTRHSTLHAMPRSNKSD